MQSVELQHSNVKFIPHSHRYISPDGEVLSGVTRILSKHIFYDKYKNVPKKILQQAAERGTRIHEECRDHDMFGMSTCDEAIRYHEIKAKHGLVTVENEYLVSDNLHFATMVDIVFQGSAPDKFHLSDIKTTLELDLDYLSWQLSINATLFEFQNPELTVEQLSAIWLNKDHSEFIPVPRIEKSIVIDLLLAEINGDLFINPVPSVKPPKRKRGQPLETPEIFK